MEMKFKENCGVDPVTLGKGYTALEDNTPYSGENINNPRHVQEEKQVAKLQAEYGWPDEKEPENGPEGFLERDIPSSYERPGRSDMEDMG